MTDPAATFQGVLVPALTPFHADLSPDTQGFVAHCRWLLDQGADGLAVFGTTSEANSIGLEERMGLLEALIDAGIPAARLMPGTGTCALTDTQRLTAHAVDLGCGGVLMLPPFYYKNVSDDGLFASFARVIDGVGRSDLRVYLYHIPPLSQTPLSLELVRRLREAYPGIVVGLKDSGGDWKHTQALLEAFPGFATFCGSEVFLLDTLRGGGAGTITATANINLPAIRKVVEHAGSADAEALQQHITTVRTRLQAFPTIPALKAVLAALHGRDAWRTVRPPLLPLPGHQAESLLAQLATAGFRLEDA